MADLVTHVCTALLPGALFRSRFLPFVVVGTVWPDALGRAVPLALERLYAVGVPVPMPVLWAWAGLHEPIGAALSALVLAFAFAEADRGRVLLALWTGCALHTGVDVLQAHHGEGYVLLAPLSDLDFELGWIGSEATVAIAGPLAIVTAAAWIPAAITASWGEPALRPRVLLWLAVPVGLALAVGGARGAAWSTAAVLAITAATWRWWPGQTGGFVAVAALWLALAATLFGATLFGATLFIAT